MLAARLEREEEEFRARMERQDREGRERLAMNREATEAETGRRATWGMPGVNPDIETRHEFIGVGCTFHFLTRLVRTWIHIFGDSSASLAYRNGTEIRGLLALVLLSRVRL